MKFRYIVFLFTVSILSKAHSQELGSESIIKRQLETYNNRNIDGFMALFNDDVQLYNQADGKLLADGKEAVRKLYTHLFEQSPKLHSDLLNRMVLGNTVIDHENITGRMGADAPIEFIVIYELKDLKISRVTVIR